MADYTGEFNTALSPEEETSFQGWLKTSGRERDLADYDMRGFWKSGESQSENEHFPDTYKKPNHETFSDESIYSNKEHPGGHWSGDIYTPANAMNNEELQPADGFVADAEAVLAVSEDADQGIRDLVDAYKSTAWDRPTQALDIIETYADKLREKHPGPQNLLSSEETFNLAPIKPPDVGMYIEEWDKQNRSALEYSTNPYIRAYKDNLKRSIEDVATGSIQQANNDRVSVAEDKLNRFVLGAFPWAAKTFESESYLKRNLRADSNDTFASTLTSTAGSLSTLALTPVNMVGNAWEFGKETYDKSLEAGSSTPRAIGAGLAEGASQALDVLADKLLLGRLPGVNKAIPDILITGLGGGLEEVAQNVASEGADILGNTREELSDLFSKSNVYAFGAGAIAGGVAKGGSRAIETLTPPTELQSQTMPDGSPFENVPPSFNDVTPNDLAPDTINNLFPDLTPLPYSSVVGEPVNGSSNLTTIEEAGTGSTEGSPPAAMESDAGEKFIINKDGSINRVVGSEKKQAHTSAMKVSPEVAQKLGILQSKAIGGDPEYAYKAIEALQQQLPGLKSPRKIAEVNRRIAEWKDTLKVRPVVIRQDDLGRNFIQHPSVTPDLTIDTTNINSDPVEIPASDTGHLLQTSRRLNDAGVVEHRAAISTGQVTDSAGAAHISETMAESSIADKIRNSRFINDNVKALLNLGEKFSDLLYVKTSDSQDMERLNEKMATYDNNYVLFANSLLLNPDIQSISADDSVLSGFASEAFSQRAEVERAAGNLEAAGHYDELSAKMMLAFQSKGSVQGQEFRMRKLVPVTGATFVSATRSQGNDLATARAAQSLELPIEEVKSVVADNKTVDKLEGALGERVNTIAQEETKAEERATEIDRKVIELEKVAKDQAQQVVEDSNEIKELQRLLKAAKTAFTKVPSPKVETLKATKKTLVKPKESPAVIAATEALKVTKDPTEKQQRTLEATRLLNEEKLRFKRESAELDAQIEAAQAIHDAEQKKVEDEAAREKERLEEEISAKKLAASRASDEQKRLNKNALDAARQLKKDTEKQRKDQLKADKERLKKERENVGKDQEKLKARRERNAKITDAVNRYKNDFEARLTPENAKKISKLAEMVQNQTGRPKELALNELGKVIAQVKGVPLVPGTNPWSTFWNSNVLLSISTNASNIFGNVSGPVIKTASDIAKGSFSKGGRFIRGWTAALFSDRSLQGLYSGVFGELPARKIDEPGKKELTDIASGITVSKESDPIRSLELKFGTGALAKAFMNSPGVSLRLLGAMDAVFSNAAKQGLAARAAPSYESYLKDKGETYDRFVNQARLEETELKNLGVETPKYYVNQRADELSFLSKPEDIQKQIGRTAKRLVFQSEEGARGIAGRTTAALLNGIANVPIPLTIPGVTKKDINTSPKNRVATALGFANKVQRQGVTLDQILPIVSSGLAEGKVLLLNGVEVEGVGTTRNLLGTLVNAINEKQIITLKGDSVRPLKYIMGMFVNTGSQLIDASMEGIPVVGYLDKRFSNQWDSYTAEDKQELYGNQIAASALASVLVATTFSHWDDEPNAPFYIYGGMRDEQLRKDYEAKGITPFSVRANIPGIGPVKFSYKDIPGFNLMLAAIGELADASMVAKRTPERPLTIGNALEAMGFGVLYAGAHLSVFKNLATFADLTSVEDIKGMQAAADVLSQTASGFVPYSGAAKEVERFVYGKLSRPGSGMNRVIQNMPYTKFFSENKPALNIFARPIQEHNIPGVSRFWGLAEDSPEIDWVLSNGYKISVLKTGNKLTDKQLESYTDMIRSDDPDNFEPYLTEDKQYEYQLRYGPQLEKTLNEYANSYPTGYDEDVQKMLTKELNQIKKTIKNDLLGE